MEIWPLVQGSFLDFVRKRVRVGKKTGGGGGEGRSWMWWFWACDT